MKIFSEELVEKAAQACHVADLSQATIGEVLLVAQYLEKETDFLKKIFMSESLRAVPHKSLQKTKDSAS